MKTVKLTWIIAHEPAYLFHRVAADFKRIVNESIKSVNIDIEILSAEEYNKKHSPNIPASRHNLWKFLQDNSVQIAQMQTTSLAKQFNKQMYVLDMPFIFDDHNHAAEVLEGEVGTFLLNNFDKSSNLKGLAYTYSGGFRLMPLNKTVSSLSEIMGATIRSGMSEIAQDTMKAFGFTPVPTEIDEVTSVIKSGEAIGAEHVAQRLLPDQCDDWIKTIVDTQHSLFLTSIVVNNDWWNSLDQEVQEIFMHAARESAKNERALSLFDGEKSVNKLVDNGVKLINLSTEEKNLLKEMTKPVYDKYESSLSFINQIRTNKE
jgi:TRAP-type C4-dicarboxylate transport system substrate-binding protein